MPGLTSQKARAAVGRFEVTERVVTVHGEEHSVRVGTAFADPNGEIRLYLSERPVGNALLLRALS